LIEAAGFLIIDTIEDFDKKFMIATLGGTIKIGLIKKQVNQIHPETLAEEIEINDKK